MMDETQFKEMVQKGFDEASFGYDRPAMRFFDMSAAHLVGLLDLKGHEHVLDAATGTGKVALLAARRLTNGIVMGFDLSEGMLAQAREKARTQSITNVSFERADVDDLRFTHGSFDVVASSFGVFFWPDMLRTLRALVPLIKPGGVFAMTSFADGSFRPLSDLCLDRFKRYGVKLPETYSWQRLDDHAKHRNLLESAGLESVLSRTAPMGYYLTDAGQWWDLVYYTGFRGFLNQLTPEQAASYKEEHLREIAGRAEERGIPLTVNVIFSTARKKQNH